LNPGDRVDVLERQANWYRVRQGENTQGWMEESTVLTNTTMARIKDLVVASQDQRPENTAVMREDTNFRLEPGRTTAIIRKLEAATMVEVLERTTLERPGSTTSFDVWLKVRPSPTEIGWVIANLVDFSVPTDIAQYTEGYVYTAVKPLKEVQDSLAGPVQWYLVAERQPGGDPHIDFSGIRVFTWNMKKHRYETAFRTTGMRGIYPLEASQQDGNPTFRVHELDAQSHDYVMTGVIVREQKKIS
jgi:hypothetical protein